MNCRYLGLIARRQFDSGQDKLLPKCEKLSRQLQQFKDKLTSKLQNASMVRAVIESLMLALHFGKEKTSMLL
jgi:hypothetical protein